jgi:hypothetical protein
MGEIPLSLYCPLRDSDLDEITQKALRKRVVELQYGRDNMLVDPSEISGVLEEEFDLSARVSGLAMDCLGKIMRNNCSTCKIGAVDGGIGILSRRGEN